MFKPTLRLFFPLFVAGSVSSLECLSTDASECTDGEPASFFKCLNNHIVPKECEPPTDRCMEAVGIDKDDNRLLLKGCAESTSCTMELFQKILDNEMFNERSIFEALCQSCNMPDNCNKLKLDEKELTSTNNVVLTSPRGSQNTVSPHRRWSKTSTSPRRPRPKKPKNSTSEKAQLSRGFQITIRSQMTFFAYILLLRFHFF